MEKYSRLIGYNFGNMVYEGAYWNTETNRKQYEFTEYDEHMKNPLATHYMNYKEFKAFIGSYDYPKK